MGGGDNRRYAGIREPTCAVVAAAAVAAIAHVGIIETAA